MKTKFLMLALVAMVVSVTACGSASDKGDGGSGAADSSLKKIVIALKPDKNPDQMIAERESLEKYLSEKLGRPVEVIIPLSAAVINRRRICAQTKLP